MLCYILLDYRTIRFVVEAKIIGSLLIKHLCRVWGHALGVTEFRKFENKNTNKEENTKKQYIFKHLTIHLTRRLVALTARTVTFLGGCCGGAWIVWNSLQGSEGGDEPTTLVAISRSLYVVNGTRPVTCIDWASGALTSKIVTHDEFRAVWAYYGKLTYVGDNNFISEDQVLQFSMICFYHYQNILADFFFFQRSLERFISISY